MSLTTSTVGYRSDSWASCFTFTWMWTQSCMTVRVVVCCRRSVSVLVTRERADVQSFYWRLSSSFSASAGCLSTFTMFSPTSTPTPPPSATAGSY